MRNLIIVLFLCLPFLASAQQNKQDSFFESFTSVGSVKNGVYSPKLAVVSVDWYDNILTVSGVSYSFVIVRKECAKYECATYLRLSSGFVVAVISDKDGLKACLFDGRLYSVDIDAVVNGRGH